MTTIGEQAFRDRRQRITVQPLRNGMTSLIRSHLMLVSIGSWAVLLLSCTNATLLLAVRAANRRRDTAIRMAVGASGPRLIKDIVVEATAITMYGAVIAWLTWAVARSVLVASVPASIRGFTVDATDGRVMALSLILPAICSIVASVIPVMLALKADPLMLLRIDDADQSMTAIPGTKVLLCIEAALCCGALIIAQATVPPFIKLMIAGPGFNAQDLFVADVSHGTTEDDPYGNGHRFERVRAIGDVVSHQPNIQQMAMALRAPFDSTSLDSPFWKAVGREGAEYGISSGLFATLGVPVTAGRDISDSDVREAREVALVNETGASALTPTSVEHGKGSAKTSRRAALNSALRLMSQR